MNTELHHYAMSLDGEKLSSSPKACVWILLSIFLIPTLIMNVWIGLTIIFLYLGLSHCVKKENDIHSKGLLKWGLFLLFLGIEVLLLVVMLYKIVKLVKSFLVSLLILLVVYEVVFAIKIKQKVYSGTDKAKKKVSKVLAGTSCLCGFGIGRLLARFGNADVILWIMILLCSVLIVGSVSVFQKVLVYKSIKK